MNSPPPIRIVGVGSPVGDDALAWEVVRQLRKQWAGLPAVDTYLVEGGQRLLDLLDGRGTLVLVDALAAGTTPGTIHRFDWPDLRIEALRPGSTHDLQPAEALRLAEVLGLAPPRIIVFGIEIGSLDPLLGLSKAVTAALPLLVRRIVEELAAGWNLDECSGPTNQGAPEPLNPCAEPPVKALGF